MKLIDDFLNRTTMYRLVFYYLFALLLVALIFSIFELLNFSPISLVASVAFLIVFCFLTNEIFARVFNAPSNPESTYISALILSLILAPIRNVSDVPLLFWAAVLTIASKYIIAINKKHVFNPVALGVVITSFAINYSANWWIGTMLMLPLVLLGGFLIIRKIKRSAVILTFLATSLILILIFSIQSGTDPIDTLRKAITSTPIIFFAFVMLTEPISTPPTKLFQIIYGGLVGILFPPQIHVGSIFSTPEIALCLGNIFSFIISPKKLVLTLKEKIQISPDIYDFIFEKTEKFPFIAGQYLEWTLGHKNSDARGIRRYFTIASAPTESNFRIGVKFYPNSSSYKKKLLGLNKNETIIASQLSGDFILPNDPNKKLVFIAGGIGITPFRSIIKHLSDTSQKRDIVLFYSNFTLSDIVYKDIFENAKTNGVKTIYNLSEKNSIPENWDGHVGFITAEEIAQEVPDYHQRLFYISGSHSMVTAFEEILNKMGIKKSQIKVDYFPGFV